MSPSKRRADRAGSMDEGAEVAVIGAGGHGRVVASTLTAAGISVSGFWDDDPDKWGRRIGITRVVGPMSELADSGVAAIIAIGDNRTRRQIAATLQLHWVTAVHPAAWIDPDVHLGPGTIVCAGAILQAGARVGAHAIVNSRAGVDHDADLGDYAHISAAHLGAGAAAGEGAFIGIGSVVLPFKRVGAWATVGAGAIVTRDVRGGMTVIGNPAREMEARGGVRVAAAPVHIKVHTGAR